MLKIKDLRVSYGPVDALSGISLTVREGQIVSLVGSNGAGKTTTLKTIMGLVKPQSGQVLYQGQCTSQLSTTQLVDRGVSLVPEGRGIFPGLTVFENLKLGAYLKGLDQKILDWIYELFPILKQRESQLAGTLSGGEQQMLAIGRALLNKPKLLMLDEPSLGLAPKIVQSIFEVLKKLNESGTTIFLVEQNARMALSTSHQGVILELGQVILTGTGKELNDNPEVKKAFLGG